MCLHRSESSNEGSGSKRNSLDLDESLGILTPGEMKDFTMSSSMTHSMASLASLASLNRDISCENFTKFDPDDEQFNDDDCHTLNEDSKSSSPPHLLSLHKKL